MKQASDINIIKGIGRSGTAKKTLQQIDSHAFDVGLIDIDSQKDDDANQTFMPNTQQSHKQLVKD